MDQRVTFREVFARFLRLARGDRSQSDIARAARVKPQSVNEWEAGKNLPESKNTEKLLIALGLDGIGAAHLLARAASEIQQERLSDPPERRRGSPQHERSDPASR